MMEVVTLTQNPQELERANKFLYKEIFPLMGIENFEEYYNDENRSNEGISQNGNMGGYMQESEPI
jgi:hypothetical protein